MLVRFVFVCSVFFSVLGAFAEKPQDLLIQADVTQSDWAKEQIDSDLSYWRQRKISRKKVRESLKKGDEGLFLLAHVKIKDGEWTFTSDAKFRSDPHQRLQIFERVFPELMAGRDLPDTEFLITGHDNIINQLDLEVPIFTFAKEHFDTRGICIPDHEALGGYSNLWSDVVEASEEFTWDKKIDMAFWRGATTGCEGPYYPFNCLNFPRSKLVRASIRKPDYLDARFNFYILAAGEAPRPILLKHCPLAESVSAGDSLKYKYLINIDGNTCSFSRMFWVMLSNSVLLKQESDHIQWYYRAVKPWIHYIPFAYDCKDIYDAIDWARSHDDEARAMSQRSSELVGEIFSQDAVADYLERVINAYTECLVD